mmetsp:Transcript_12871/g.21390  ORF Transcript_12871/g.21390 Transcript_12871/m.21390 type:complete len:544 (-) Transcript_12871:514-2145(-)
MPVDTECFEKVSVHLSAKGLEKVGTFSPTMNAFAVLYEVDPYNARLMPVGVTNLVKENCDPEWTSVFMLNYHFEAFQEFLVKVFHHENASVQLASNVNNLNLDKEHWVGDARFVLSNLMCAPAQKVSVGFSGDKAGSIEVRGEIIHNTRNNFVATFACNKLSNKEGFFSTSDPFLKFSRLNEDATWTAVWQNTRVDNSLNPRWAEVKIPITLLCNGDIDRPLKIEIFDHEKSGKHAPMGEVETSVRGMVSSNGTAMNVIEPAKKLKKGAKYVNSGTFHATHAYIEENPTFSDFIAGGMDVSLVVAVDFTASNGDPAAPSSLHYCDPLGHANTYQQAITAVGSVLEPYDTDKMYPVYGFGAKLRGPDGKYGPAQHCFPVYGGGLEVKGVDGILQAYKDSLQHVMLSGPTLFGPLVNAAAQRAAVEGCTQEKQKYQILLILTDGVINDMEATKAAIVAASNQPLSIIIIGIGNANFAEMNVLDSDKQLLSHNGVSASRDIVQFVSFKEYILKGPGKLAEQVLAEVPTQVLLYMKQHALKANTPKP